MFALRAQIGAFHALMIRDLMLRFGRNNLGFVWTILEPMILTTGVMLVWSIIKEPTIHGVAVITFVFTGYMPLTLWRHLTNPMPGILRNNSNLLYHRGLLPIHVMLARAVLEFLSTSAALVIVYFIVISVGLVEPVADFGRTLGAWLFTGWYFGGMGLLMGALAEYWEPSEKFVQPAQYLALPVSGVFFMLDWMPEYARKLLLFNPSVHCFEMFRSGFLGEELTTYYDPWYLAITSAVMTIFGLVVVAKVRDRIRFN